MSRLADLRSESEIIKIEISILNIEYRRFCCLRFRDHDLRFLGNYLRLRDHDLRFFGNNLRLRDHDLRFFGNYLRFRDHDLRFFGNYLRLRDHDLRFLGNYLRFFNSLRLLFCNRCRSRFFPGSSHQFSKSLLESFDLRFLISRSSNSHTCMYRS